MPLLSDAFALAEKLGGKPRVLFTFVIGGRMWRYAQSVADVTVAATGLTYTRAKIQVDGDVDRRDDSGPQRIAVRMGIRLAVVAELRKPQTEPMYLAIHRFQPDAGGSPIRWAWGEIASIQVTSGWCTVELQTEEANWDRQIPRAVFAPQCQYQTYSPECGLDASAFSFATTITAINGPVLALSSVNSKPDDYYSLGILKIGNSFWYISKHTGLTARIFGKLPSGLALPAACTIYAGDDLTHETCRTKFSNIDNFMGFKWLPSKNPLLDLEHCGPDSLIVSTPFPDPGGYSTPAKFLWYRADKPGAAPLTDPPVAGYTLTGGNVSTWIDQSGNGRDATQAGGSIRPGALAPAAAPPVPYHETAALGFGPPSEDVPFANAGATDTTWLNLPSFSSLSAADIFLTIQATADPPARSQWGVLLAIHQEGQGNNYFVVDVDGRISDGTGLSSGSPFSYGPSPIPFTTPNTVLNWTIAAGEWTFRVNGIPVYHDTGEFPFSIGFNQINPTLGSRGDSFGFRGRMMRMLVYPSPLNNADRATTQAYMTAGAGSPA